MSDEKWMPSVKEIVAAAQSRLAWKVEALIRRAARLAQIEAYERCMKITDDIDRIGPELAELMTALRAEED